MYADWRGPKPSEHSVCSRGCRQASVLPRTACRCMAHSAAEQTLWKRSAAAVVCGTSVYRSQVKHTSRLTPQHRSVPLVTGLQSIALDCHQTSGIPPGCCGLVSRLGRPHLTLQGLEAGCSALLPVLLRQHCIEAGGGRSVVQVEADSSDHMELPIPEGGMAQDARHLLAQAVQVIWPLDADVQRGPLHGKAQSGWACCRRYSFGSHMLNTAPDLVWQ